MRSFTAKAQSARGFSGALCLLLLAGCATAPGPSGPLVDADETLLLIDEHIRPEKLLFPKYLMLEGGELEQHGRVPGTSLLAAELVFWSELGEVRRRYRDVLTAKGWKIDRVEATRRSFRLFASNDEGEAEIRAVEGTTTCRVFILLKPAAD